jgi:beta-glucosidase
VDDRTLHEIHLAPFEAAVQEAGVWSIMTAYNRINGLFGSEQSRLLGAVLRDSWGFDGLVVSDWFGTHSTGPAALAGLDLEMPGPAAWFGSSLAGAVSAGDVDESVVDEKVRNLLRLMARVGILDGDGDGGGDGDGAVGRARAVEKEEDDPGRRAVARQVATEGMVLLTNNGVLPLLGGSDGSGASISSVAVIGPNAGHLELGGGSSEVTPHRHRYLHEALRERLPDVAVTYEPGCHINLDMPSLDIRLLSSDGFSIEYFDNPSLDGAPVASESGHSARLLWVGHLLSVPDFALPTATSSVRVRAEFVPDVSGVWRLGLESAGRSVWRINGDVAVDNSEPKRGKGFFGAGSAMVEVDYEFEAWTIYTFEFQVRPAGSAGLPIMGMRLAAEPPRPTDEFERAVAAAAASDVALVVVGSNGSWESEGFDRPDLSLPGDQRRLVEAVIAANPRTVVIINAGSPVEMPWADSAAAVLLPWYAGEEGADAIADVVVGLSDPGGRLPVTVPKLVEDISAHGFYPGGDGVVVYGEGIMVGYRHTATAASAHFAFGHGLSYATFEYGDAVVGGDGDVDGNVRSVTVEVTNTSARSGSEVVQVYVHPLSDAPVERPERALAAFEKVTVAPGATERVTLKIGDRSFSYWSESEARWELVPGRYELLVGSSSRDIHQVVEVTVS